MGKQTPPEYKGPRPWLTEKKKTDNKQDGRFIQIGNSLYLSKKYQALPDNAARLYGYMAMEAGGSRRFKFPQRRATGTYGIPKSAFWRQVEILVAAKFIKRYSPGKPTREETMYEFIEDWKDLAPFNYKGFTEQKKKEREEKAKTPENSTDE